MKLKETRIAALATDGFDAKELYGLLEAFKIEGATVDIVSIQNGYIKPAGTNVRSSTLKVNQKVDSSPVHNYDALVLTGGAINLEQLKEHTLALNFIKAFIERTKPVGAIGQAPYLFVASDLLEGKKVTSSLDIKEDIMNAGGKWIDEKVVVDNGLVTCGKTDNLSMFCTKFIKEIIKQNDK
ncbi:DJ-1/PfpI family protein [uncultured Zobellia sp.]|uniref:DJ-1/PfpI family protein n=1 Tax=uncultured Zobellia sp. TaxID=255433 RepID=UPI0025993900|nr:DJ-1/PfpI family protein [uncultured Zobellia sp.]